MTIISAAKSFCRDIGLPANTPVTVLKSAGFSFLANYVWTLNPHLAVGVAASAVGATLIHAIASSLLDRVVGLEHPPEWGKAALMGLNIIALVPLLPSPARRINVLMSCLFTAAHFFNSSEPRHSWKSSSTYIFV